MVVLCSTCHKQEADQNKRQHILPQMLMMIVDDDIAMPYSSNKILSQMQNLGDLIATPSNTVLFFSAPIHNYFFKKIIQISLPS